MVQRLEKFDEETRRIVTQNRLVAVSKPEVHARVQSLGISAIIACSLVVQMKEEVARNPSLTLGKRKKRSCVSYIHNLRRNQETGPG